MKQKFSEDTAATENLSEAPITLSNVIGTWTNTTTAEYLPPKEEANGCIKDSATTLKNISFEIEKGTLCAIIGPVGAGKVCAQNF